MDCKDIVLHISKGVGLFAVARRLTRRGLRILCYHGFELADETLFRPKLFISVDDFAKRMELLARRRYLVLPLAEALDRLAQHSLPPSAVVITIDDGFHAVRAGAVEILKRHGFPATVYVRTCDVETNLPIFCLAVRYMFARTAERGIDVRGRSWLPDGWIDLESPGGRDRAADAVIDFGERRCSEHERQQICRELAELLHVDYERIQQTRILSLMNREELREMQVFGVDVQLHTHRHQLPTDDKEAAQGEILDNRRELERMLGPQRFEHFCYPNGLYSRSQWPWLSELGVISATTCEPGLNFVGTPRLGLRRFLDDSQVSLITFEAELSGYLELARRGRAAIRRLLQSWRTGWSVAQRAVADR